MRIRRRWVFLPPFLGPPYHLLRRLRLLVEAAAAGTAAGTGAATAEGTAEEDEEEDDDDEEEEAVAEGTYRFLFALAICCAVLPGFPVNIPVMTDIIFSGIGRPVLLSNPSFEASRKDATFFTPLRIYFQLHLSLNAVGFLASSYFAL